MTQRRLNRTARWIGNVLLIAGATAVVIWTSSFFSLRLWQYWQNRIFEQQRTSATLIPEQETYREPRRVIKDGEIVGRLGIPRIHLQAMIREGDGERTLSLALGHIPGTAFPGELGNIGLAGHRDTLFSGLKDIVPDDEITFETTDASYAYRVESTKVVKPEDVGVLSPGPVPELTLVTCFPFEYVGSAPDRFIVKARLISENAGHHDIPEESRQVAVATVRPKPVPEEIAFDVEPGHSRELVTRKIWFGLSSADATRRNVDGWLWVMPERQTIWLRDVDAQQPVVFYQDGQKRELVITSVGRSSVRGYLLPSPG